MNHDASPAMGRVTEQARQPDAAERTHETRTDPVSGTVVHVVGTRQGRPNLPSTGCPFCVGGREAPEPYDVLSFPNRWPAMPDDRCEVVLYTPDHDATFASLGPAGARRVIDLWAERTEQLGARPDVDYVLVFENRGPDVGATIAHPHGQIYAYDHVPARQLTRLRNHWRPRPAPQREIVERDGWVAYVPEAPVFPIAVELAPVERVADLAALSGAQRDSLAAVLADLTGGLDLLFEQPLPYMMWINQRPTINADRAGALTEAVELAIEAAWLNIEIVSPWRAAGVPRFIAAAEVASDEYFNPVVPEEIAERLRAAVLAFARS